MLMRPCSFVMMVIASKGACEVCEASGCPVQKACNMYNTDKDCPESHCTFIYFENDGDDFGDDRSTTIPGVCTDHQCVGMGSEQDCDASKLGCSWDKDNYRCWPTGLSAPCSEIYYEAACTAAGCDFSDFECSEKGQVALCHLQYTEGDCTALSSCEYTNYRCHEKASAFPATPPPLSGNGDGTGNEDMAKCTPALYSQVKAKLEAAETECVIDGRKRERRGSAKDQQLECLAYFLGQTPNPTTVTAACPCLWAWATEIMPEMDHWMRIKC